MPKNSRNDRNNPYLVEGWAVDFHRSKAGIAWRWRTELAFIAVTVAGYLRLAAAITALWALITLAAFITAALLVPYSRRFTVQHYWCLVSRHRLQRVCYETRMHTRAGRLPLIVWIRPTRVGERAFVALPGWGLRRGLRRLQRRDRLGLLRPRSAGHPQQEVVPRGDHRHRPPRPADGRCHHRFPHPPHRGQHHAGHGTGSDVIEPTTVIPPKDREPVA